MTPRVPLLSALLAAALAAAGCVGAYADGSAALAAGRWVEAADRFEEVLARNPDSVDALVGLGLAKYRAGVLDEAADALDRAVTIAPRLVVARLYLGLARLRRAEDGPAEEHLSTAARLAEGSRTATQIHRALVLLRGRDPVNDEFRAFIADSIDEASELEREVRNARAAIRELEFNRRAGFTTPVVIRRHRSSPLPWLLLP